MQTRLRPVQYDGKIVTVLLGCNIIYNNKYSSVYKYATYCQILIFDQSIIGYSTDIRKDNTYNIGNGNNTLIRP